MFRAQAERHPGGTAVRQGDEARIYRELRAAAEELAGRLYRRGVRPRTPVAVHMERGVHAVVALLAVLRLGATYVPLDVHHPLERSRAALRAAGATCVLVCGDAPFEDAEAVDLLRPEPGEEVPVTAPSPALDDHPLPAKVHSLQELIGQLLNTTAMTISRVVKSVRPVLDWHGVHTPASSARAREQLHVCQSLSQKRRCRPRRHYRSPSRLRYRRPWA
ncbi:AMP-binding protein [Streptomyces sp. NPDC048252]|uniref:AMP-binding protein n=1 Tax=Streptomyces sp. NPDC048252 TaxID=3154612 RepID=UPI0034163C4F